MNCQPDYDCLYINSINNSSSYDIVVHLQDDSIIDCLPGQETIIDEFYGNGVMNLFRPPHRFKNIISEVIVDGGSKILTKDIFDDNNWNIKGDKDGKFYGKIRSSFVINEENIKELEQ